ncbi:hypothetical protein, partial [Mycobacterium sp. NPDC006124]|uniref:hypothetical protein n=1 Tax=Mycobacterium sp. NPDC006124 TaxID=3156729 RepID=UPI0033A7072D
AGDDGTTTVPAKLVTIDTTTGNVISTTPFDGPTIGPLVLTPDGSRALQLVSLPDAFAFGGTKVYVIDTTTGTVIAAPLIGDPPNANLPILLNDDGTTAYVIRDLSKTISPQITTIDTTTGTVLTNTGIDRGGNITGYTLTAHGTRLLINKSAGDDGTITVPAKLFVVNTSLGQTIPV